MKQSITLSMIVKNEEPVIRRCLESVKPWIDEWVIVDTGSTDNTLKIIEETMEDVPGKVYQQPWVNFGTNRTQALDLAVHTTDATHILFIDADEMLEAPESFQWPDLTADGYYFPTHYAGTVYARCALVSTRLQWKWVGVLHESLESSTPARFDSLTTPTILVRHEGARARDPKTYENDALVLEEAIKKEPNNARYMFYLAQSWRDAQHPRKAKFYYQERSQMPGFVEETWYAMYEIGRMNEVLEFPVEQVQGAYLAAYQFRPTRAEPLYELARYHRLRREFDLAVLFAEKGMQIRYPEDRLFVGKDIYDWKLKDEYAISAYYTKEKNARLKGRIMTEQLLDIVPVEEVPRIEMNLRLYKELK